jgi:hypothetical protein
MAAGRAVLKHLKENNLVAAADLAVENSAAAHLKTALESLHDCPGVGDVRGIGLLWAVEFVVDKRTKDPFPPEQAFSSRIGQEALQRGLLVYPMQGSVDGIAGDHILIAPPAVISQEQIHWSVAQLRDAIEASVAN